MQWTDGHKEEIKKTFWEFTCEVLEDILEYLDGESKDSSQCRRFMEDLKRYLDAEADENSLTWELLRGVYDNEHDYDDDDEDADPDLGFYRVCEKIAESWEDYPAPGENTGKAWFDDLLERKADAMLNGGPLF